GCGPAVAGRGGWQSATTPVSPAAAPRPEAASVHPWASDILPLCPLVIGHHLFQIDQNQQLVVLVACALAGPGRLVSTTVRRGLALGLTQVDPLGDAVDQNADRLAVRLDDHATGLVGHRCRRQAKARAS